MNPKIPVFVICVAVICCCRIAEMCYLKEKKQFTHAVQYNNAM